MAESPNASSRIPRPSRLPIPKGARPSPSRDSLRTTTTLSVPRVRKSPFRDQISTIGDLQNPTARIFSSLPTDTQPAPSDNDEGVFKKPLSRPSSSHQEPTQQLIRHNSNHTGTGSSAESSVLPENQNPIHEETISRKPRLSLSERTMETLAQLPSSPAIRSSSVFNTNDSPVRPPSQHTNNSRPGSSYRSDISMLPPSRSISSGPGSFTGPQTDAIPIDFRASTRSTANDSTPQRMLAPKSLKTPLRVKSYTNLQSSSDSPKLPSPIFGTPSKERSSSPVKAFTKHTVNNSNVKSVTSRPLKPRESVGGLARKPSIQTFDKIVDINESGFSLKKPSPTFSNASSDTTATSMSSKESSTTVDSNGDQTTAKKGSNALREQIAKAKAAKRAQVARQTSASLPATLSESTAIIPAGTFDFGLADDPFNQNAGQDVGKGLLRKRIDAARIDGRLNIAAMGLKEMPNEVMNMYHLESIGEGGSWAETVDLTRFVAADNEFESLGDEVFPDVDPRELQDDDDSEGNQFGGLETLDLHGNVLKTVPPGLRRLEMLTTLNVSNNKLENNCFDVISQISSLRELKIGKNNISGKLSSGIASLQNLEILDVQNNRLSSLPEGIVELVRLRVLILTENAFNSLPFEALHKLPLIELSAAQNKLDGILIPVDYVEFPNLQILDVTGNSLKSLTSGEIIFPALHQLSCSVNRLTSLPDMTSWKSLLSLTAEDNHISTIPEGFVSLTKLKSVVLTGNNLNVLDDRIGNMPALDILRLSGNPLREKKLSGMTTEDLKRTLKARLTPGESELATDECSDGDIITSNSPGRISGSDWPVKAGGVLDRSNTQSFALNPVVVAQIAAKNTIRELRLDQNKFFEIPSSIGLFASLTSLSLAHNELNADTFLKDDLELTVLKELNLSSNTFNSLQPLLQRFYAPMLEKLDISFNRLTTLPVLRSQFPRLTVVFASNNTIRELSPEAVKGLKILDCSSNDLNSLNARIGLLGGPGGLERLEVKGNRFRVPKYTVLDKGTEATLAWLRDRIPAGEMSPTEGY